MHTWDLPYYDLWGDQKPRSLRAPKTAHKFHINSPVRNISKALTLRNSVLSYKSISVEIGGAGRRKAGPGVSGKASPREKQTDSGCFCWQQQCLCVSPVLRSVIKQPPFILSAFHTRGLSGKWAFYMCYPVPFLLSLSLKAISKRLEITSPPYPSRPWSLESFVISGQLIGVNNQDLAAIFSSFWVALGGGWERKCSSATVGTKVLVGFTWEWWP